MPIYITFLVPLKVFNNRKLTLSHIQKFQVHWCTWRVEGPRRGEPCSWSWWEVQSCPSRYTHSFHPSPRSSPGRVLYLLHIHCFHRPPSVVLGQISPGFQLPSGRRHFQFHPENKYFFYYHQFQTFKWIIPCLIKWVEASENISDGFNLGLIT